MKKIFFISIMGILLFSCKRNIKTEDLSYNYNNDTILLSDNEKYEYMFFDSRNDSIFSFTKKFKNDSLFIKLLDTTSMKFSLFSYTILSELFSNNDSTGIIEQLKFSGNDSISIFQYFGTTSEYTHSRITLFDLKQHKISYSKDFYVNYNNRPSYTIDKEFIYSSKKNGIYYILWPYEIFTEFLAFHDIASNRDMKININKPKEYNIKENQINPFFTGIFLNEIDSQTLLISFGISPNIIEYDITNNTIQNHVIRNTNYRKSKFLMFDVKPLNYNDVLRVIEQSYFNTKFSYDQYNNVYYRFFNKEMPDKDKEGYYTSYEKHKESGISVITKDFIFLGDVIFPPNFRFFLRPHTITSSGIRFFEKRGEEKYLVVHKLNIIQK